MHKDMDRLHELQELDTAMAELQVDLRGLDDGSALRERVAAAEEELNRRRATYREHHAIQGRKEGELAKAEQKRKELMDKAYGGTISNPKELETLEKEIDALSRMKDRLETELLELFDQVDSDLRAVREQEAIVSSLKTELEQTTARFESERARIQQELARLRKEREQVSAQVDPSSLQLYQRIKERCGNLAVSVVRDRVCTACRVTLPIVLLDRLSTGSDFEKCESCTRLLWIESEPDTEGDDS